MGLPRIPEDAWVGCPGPVEQVVTPEEAREALARARAGDQDAWVALFTAFTPMMEAAVTRYGGLDADVQDARQDAWTRAIVWVSDPAHGVGSVKAWLYRTTCNQWFDTLRRKKRGIPSRHQVPTGAAPVADRRPSPGSALVLRETEALYAHALARLSADEREIVRLILDEGLDRRTAGNQLGIQPGTAKTRFLRAKRRLRRMIRDELGSA